VAGAMLCDNLALCYCYPVGSAPSTSLAFAPLTSDASSSFQLEHASLGAGALVGGLMSGESLDSFRGCSNVAPNSVWFDSFSLHSSPPSLPLDTHLAMSERWVLLCEVDTP
jgi:hypothetical protein